MQRNIVPKKKSYERPTEILVETLREILVGAQILRLLHKNRNWSNSSPSSELRVARSLDKKIAKFLSSNFLIKGLTYNALATKRREQT